MPLTAGGGWRAPGRRWRSGSRCGCWRGPCKARGGDISAGDTPQPPAPAGSPRRHLQALELGEAEEGSGLHRADQVVLQVPAGRWAQAQGAGGPAPPSCPSPCGAVGCECIPFPQQRSPNPSSSSCPPGLAPGTAPALSAASRSHGQEGSVAGFALQGNYRPENAATLLPPHHGHAAAAITTLLEQRGAPRGDAAESHGLQRKLVWVVGPIGGTHQVSDQTHSRLVPARGGCQGGGDPAVGWPRLRHRQPGCSHEQKCPTGVWGRPPSSRMGAKGRAGGCKGCARGAQGRAGRLR